MDGQVGRLEALVKSLSLPDFDLLLIGDGSGTTSGNPCGWSCTAYERATGSVWEHHGGASGGTNNYAELEPYVHCLTAYRHALWSYHTTGRDVRPPRVVIVSDSEVTCRCGNGQYQRKANGPLWASIKWFEDKGYTFSWVHVRRLTNEFNRRADKIAGTIRKKMSEVAPPP